MVVFSPDGTRIATASHDRTARVYDAAGTELARLHHDGPVVTVAFSPDSTRIATASHDRTARVWIIARELLIEQAEKRLTRNLTAQEWRRYFGAQPRRKTRADLP